MNLKWALAFLSVFLGLFVGLLSMVEGWAWGKSGPISIEVDLRGDGKDAPPISDLIYGSNDFFFGNHTTELRFPIVRFGGNHTSRYNWRTNTWNAGKDWYYMNIPLEYEDVEGQLLKTSYTDALLKRSFVEKRPLLITAPMMGWVAKSRERSWGFSVKKYGPQSQAEEERSKGDAGNGFTADWQPLRKGNPEDTSIRFSPAELAAWVKHNRKLAKEAGREDVTRFYALDNEPMLWHETHQDIRYGDRLGAKTPRLSLEELWERTVAYASAIRSADPEAKILGPVVWGWCAYHYSAADQCAPGEDFRKVGKKPLLRWYMQELKKHEEKTGVRLVDVLDVHYYPESEPHFEDDSTNGQRIRLASVHSLFDPDFKDGSWIDEPIQLIPRLKKWMKEEGIELEIAITEYRFGGKASDPSAAVANAEAMAIFGREGVKIATYWSQIPKDSALEGAWRLFLDYDGQGSNALGGKSRPVSVGGNVQFSAEMPVTAYAIQSGSKVLVYVFNRSFSAQKVSLGLQLDTAQLSQVAWNLKRRFELASGRPLAQSDKIDVKNMSVTPLSVTLLEYERQ